MGRTRLERAVAKLRKEAEQCKKHKKKILNYVEDIKNKCLDNEITHWEYEQLLDQKLEGKTIQEWLDEYDSHIKHCEKKIKKEIKKFKTKKVLLIFSSLVLISLILLSAFYLKPIIVDLFTETELETGVTEGAEPLATKLPSEKIQEEAPQEDLSPSQKEPLLKKIIYNIGAKISEISKKIYNTITGFIVEEPIEELPEENITEAPGVTEGAKPLAPENITEPEAPPKNITEEIEEEIPEEEEIEEEIPEEIPKNITQAPILIKQIPDIEIEKNKFIYLDITDYFSGAEDYYLLQTENLLTTTFDHTIKIQPEQDFTGTRTVKIIATNDFGTVESNFFDIIVSEAVKTPVLIKEIPDIQIQKNSYTDIKISDYFQNAEEFYFLQAKNILTTTFDHTIKIQPDKDFTGTRKSKIIVTNEFGTIESNFFNIIVSEIAVPEEIPKVNITIPEIPANITEITEQNATITTQQYGAVINKPVKWKKHIQLEKPGITKIRLPKQAENIIVNKIIEAEAEQEESQKSYSEETQEAPKEDSSPSQEESLASEGETKSVSNKTQNKVISEQETISRNKPKDTKNKIIKKAKATITGIVIKQTGETQEKTFFKSMLRAISNFFKKSFATITGRAITTEELQEAIEVTIEDTGIEYEIEYETPAPQSTEKQISNNKKQITISAPDELNYTNILAFTNLTKEVPLEKIRFYHLVNGSRQEIQFTAQDLNNNSLIDYIEWVVLHLSNQTYELIIEISAAEHLDVNKTFISDIYNEVYQLDDIWSEPIPSEHYVRVTFKQPLDNTRDITIYPRITQGNPKIEVYEINSNQLIAEFTNIQSNQYNKVFLTNLISESQDIFDLKITGGTIEFDHIIDPQETLYVDGFDSTFTAWDSSVNPPYLDNLDSSYIHELSSNTVKVGNFSFANTGIGSGTINNVTLYFEANNSDGAADDGFDVYLKNASGNAHTLMGRILPDTTMNWYTLNVSSMLTTWASIDSANMWIQYYKDGGGDNVWVRRAYLYVDYESAEDNTPPDIIIRSPSNKSYNTISVLFNVTATDGTGVSSCWYSLNSAVKNYTLANSGTSYSDTNSSMAQGARKVNYWCNDSSTNANVNSTMNIDFTVDTTYPLIKTTYPTNATNSSDNTLRVNYTFSDTNAETCWWTNDTGTNNYTLASCGTNITNKKWPEGPTTVFVYINDTANNLNFSQVTFTIDTEPPSYDSLTDQILYVNTSLNYDIDATDATLTVDCFSVNDTTNFAITCAGVLTNKTGLSVGAVTLNITVNDTVNNKNSTNLIINVNDMPDTTLPNVAINTPTNTTYNTNSILFNITATDNKAVSSCWYSFNLGVKNYTMTNATYVDDYTHTNETMAQGARQSRFWCNDTSNRINDTMNVSFFIDSVYPLISITYPPNTTNTTDSSLRINYTFSDTNVGSCWWTNDTGANNYTLASCGTNITNKKWPEGLTTMFVYINDTANNVNFSQVTFKIDTNYPNVTINTPTNTTYNTNLIEFNVTATDSVKISSCWYSLNSAAKNYTMSNSGNLWTNTNSSMTQGGKRADFWCNDTANNVNATKDISFFIDSVYPLISITYPPNSTNTTDTSLRINYTFSDTNVGSCWWTNDTGTNNYTLTSCGTNITNKKWPEGLTTVFVYINDTANNLNFSQVTFTIDTTNPLISITYPPNTTNTTDSSLRINYTFSDTNPSVCWWTNDTGANNYTLASCGTNITNKKWPEGPTTVFVYINDTANNVNFSQVTFTVDSTPPQVNITSPLNQTYSVSSIDFNFTLNEAGNCEYTLNLGVTNYTMTANASNTGFNATNSSIADGSYTVFAYCNDAAGNTNYTENVMFGIETGTNVTICRTLSSANTEYKQTADIINDDLSENCIIIAAQNITYDGKGYYISSDDDVSGIYSNQINTTIKNCNVSMSPSYPGLGIELEGANNSYIFNNTLNSQYYGLYLGSTGNTKIENNTVGSNTYGIYLSYSSNNTITNNTASSNSMNGIMLSSSQNNTLINNIANSCTSVDCAGYYIAGDNNILIDNTASSNAYYGITAGGSNIQINGSIINSNKYPLSLSSVHHSRLINNTLNSNEWGIYLYSASNNILIDNNIWNCTTTSYANLFLINSDNNTISGGIINLSSNDLILLWTNSDNNIFRDIQLIGAAGNDTFLKGTSVNNTFLNVSYTSSKEYVNSSSELIRKWYYRAYVNDTSGNNVSNANVTAYNASDDYQFNLTTDSTGYTGLGEIIDYVSNGTRYYYSNYTIYATNDSYPTLSHTYNVTAQGTSLSGRNNLKDVFTLDNIYPKINLTYPINTTYATSTFTLNYTFTETNPSKCWWTNSSGSWNSTTQTCGTNWTQITAKEGSNTWIVYINDTAGNENKSSVTFTVTSNQAPNNPSPNLDSVDGTNTTSTDLNCSSTITDPDSGDELNVTIQWYKNSVLDLTFYYNNSYSNGTLFNATLGSGNTTAGQNWSCGLKLNDGTASSSWVNSSNITILNTAPNITRVYNETISLASSGPNEAPAKTYVLVNFTVYDADSVSDLNDSSAMVNFTLAGEDTRQNLTCIKYENTTNYANYTCNVTMWWWDGAGTWAISTYIKDNSQNPAINSSKTFTMGQRTGFELSPATLNWSYLAPGSLNQTSINDPILLNNTGNDNIVINTIQINSTNLLGEENSDLGLWASNFSVATFTGGTPPAECNTTATTMSALVYTNITGALLPAGNYTKNYGNSTSAQEQLYFCIRIIGSELTEQAYSTDKGDWIIRIMLVALTIKGISKLKKKKRKKKKTKQKIIENLTLPSTIFSNKKLGCLEAVTKYLKENLEMTYHEIAEILNRDDRTIWTAYKKAIEKQPEEIKLEKILITLPTIKLEKIFIVLPVSIFKNKKLTILESIIIYLKQKELKFSEIAKLLNRDQRNIWTIYSNAEKKLKTSL